MHWPELSCCKILNMVKLEVFMEIIPGIYCIKRLHLTVIRFKISFPDQTGSNLTNYRIKGSRLASIRQWREQWQLTTSELNNIHWPWDRRCLKIHNWPESKCNSELFHQMKIVRPTQYSLSQFAKFQPRVLRSRATSRQSSQTSGEDLAAQLQDFCELSITRSSTRQRILLLVASTDSSYATFWVTRKEDPQLTIPDGELQRIKTSQLSHNVHPRTVSSSGWSDNYIYTSVSQNHPTSPSNQGTDQTKIHVSIQEAFPPDFLNR